MSITDEQQNALAKAVQHSFPLTDDPYAALAQQVGIARDEALATIQSWHEAGTLREVSAVLEGGALGYDSALVAGKVLPEDLERVVEVVNAHPTVTHNYLRDHDYNLWFTIAAPQEMGVEQTLHRLAALAGVPRFMPLRRTATYKIGVNFDLKLRRSNTAVQPISSPMVIEVGERERRAFRALQTPLPFVERPFHALAEQAGLPVDELLAFAQEHKGGALRRYVGTMRHRKLGVRGNGMTVWQVEAARQDEVGAVLAAAPEVTHCYSRNAIEGFPYTVYSMIHGADRGDVEGIVSRLAGEVGVDEHLILFSTQEFKKCRLRYFLPELDRWWDDAGKKVAA